MISKGTILFNGKPYRIKEMDIIKYSQVKNKWYSILKFFHLPYKVIEIVSVNNKKVCQIEEWRK